MGADPFPSKLSLLPPSSGQVLWAASLSCLQGFSLALSFSLFGRASWLPQLYLGGVASVASVLVPRIRGLGLSDVLLGCSELACRGSWSLRLRSIDRSMVLFNGV